MAPGFQLHSVISLCSSSILDWGDHTSIAIESKSVTQVDRPSNLLANQVPQGYISRTTCTCCLLCTVPGGNTQIMNYAHWWSSHLPKLSELRRFFGLNGIVISLNVSLPIAFLVATDLLGKCIPVALCLNFGDPCILAMQLTCLHAVINAEFFWGG